MVQLRTLNKKIFLISLICTGLLTGAMRVGFYTNSNSSFTKWFASLIDGNENVEIQKKIASLKYTQEDLNNIIFRASELVKNNADAFSLSIPDDFKQGSEKLVYLLLQQWSSTEDNNKPTFVLFQKWLKSFYYSPSKIFTNFVNDITIKQQNIRAYLSCRTAVDNLCVRIIPLINSIAIGAP